jgi:D-cysteine desulfhydrase
LTRAGRPVNVAAVATALERAFPALAGRLPLAPCTTLPTAVHRLEALGRARGTARLWVKRDDRSGALYGGNKPRKLELILGDARRRGARTLLTFGAIGTHHGLATAILARTAGMRTVLVLLPQPLTPAVRRNLLLLHAYGAELHLAPSVPRVAATAAGLLAAGIAGGDRPRVVATGGSSVLGTLGFVGAGLELAEQVRAGELPAPDTIVVPLGSGGTAAGLAVGLRLGGLRSRVLAVLVTDVLAPSARRLQRLAGGALAVLRRLDATVPAVTLTGADLLIETGFVGRGYGAVSAEAEAARRLMAETEGIALETTYTAKALAALLAAAAAPPYREQTLLFWNTYSSVDPAAALDRLPEPRELPAAFHRFFV